VNEHAFGGLGCEIQAGGIRGQLQLLFMKKSFVCLIEEYSTSIGGGSPDLPAELRLSIS
jgi:hypothetical protein